MYIMLHERMETQTGINSFILYIYIKFKNRQDLFWLTEVRIVVIFKKGVLTGKKHIGNFWGVGNILCLDLGDNYMDEYM